MGSQQGSIMSIRLIYYIMRICYSYQWWDENRNKLESCKYESLVARNKSKWPSFGESFWVGIDWNHQIMSIVSVRFSKNATKWPAMWAILFLWDCTRTVTKEEMTREMEKIVDRYDWGIEIGKRIVERSIDLRFGKFEVVCLMLSK